MNTAGGEKNSEGGGWDGNRDILRELESMAAMD